MIAGGHAYAADGHVLFSVPSMPDYGRLSRRPLDEMIAGARVDVAPYKKGDMDFVLWKPSADSEPGWESPWGRGRPGWHIECSAMSWRHLGETFDIHGGGIDLVFPHHENEIAQSRCCFDTPVMANVWMHNGFLQVEGEKMSKSAGNFVTIHELLHSEKFGGQLWSGPVLRLAMLRTHYRQPIDFTSKALEDARKKLDAWMRAARLALDGEPAAPEPSDDLVAALADDLNTHSALTSLDRLFNTTGDGQSDAHRQLGADLVFLGLASRSELKKPHAGFVSVDVDKVQALIDARLAARAAKNWAESDRLRDELVAMSITLKDNKDGTTTWEVKR